MTGGQVLAVLAVLLVVVLVAVAGRVLLAAAVIVGAQWAVITYWPAEHDAASGSCSSSRRCWPATPWRTALTGSTGLGSQLAPSPGRCPAMTQRRIGCGRLLIVDRGAVLESLVGVGDGVGS